MLNDPKSSINHDLPDFSPEDQETLEMIARLGQQHLVKNWPLPGQAMSDKRRFLAQIRDLDARYPGGLERYLKNASELLAKSKRGDTPYEGYIPHVPPGFRIDFGSAAFTESEELGLRQVNRCGFVLVAGGLGERLGFPGIKVELPAELATGRSFLELYIAHIIAFQRCSNQLLGQERQLPLAIMTSQDTDAATSKLLRENDYFGLTAQQITLLKQERVASIADPTPRLAINPTDPFELMTKPHGHGDVHSLLHQTGLARRWLDEGVSWLLFFQDTNALALNVLLSALGVSARESLDVNSIVVPRRAEEAIGGLVRLVKPDTEFTINVEYNQLDALLRTAPNGKGDVPDGSGYSPYPGNINTLVLAVPQYVETLEKTGGAVPEFVNPKYSDKGRTSFKTPTRLECMMQDYPRLAPGARVGYTQFERSVCFSPVKNSIEDAAARQAQTPPLPSDSAATGEADVYALHRRIVRLTGADIEDGPPETHAGVTVKLFPIVVLSPELVTPIAQFGLNISALSISPRSALVVAADTLNVDGLKLDGALEIKAVHSARILLRDLVVQNRGWVSSDSDSAVHLVPQLAIRGYCLKKIETLLIEANKPGDYVVDSHRLAQYTLDSSRPGYRIVSL